jgi:hypothetical protein
MDIVLQIALILIPAGLVLVTAIFMLKKIAERDVRNLNIEMKRDRQNHLLPLRLDAYQRLVLFCERINPNALIMRLHNPGLPALAFQQKLLAAIREEFDHNVAQQIFISTEAWDIVTRSKEETIKIINMAAKDCDGAAFSGDLAQKVFEICGQLEQLPTDIAVRGLKKELHTMF